MLVWKQYIDEIYVSRQVAQRRSGYKEALRIEEQKWKRGPNLSKSVKPIAGPEVKDVAFTESKESQEASSSSSRPKDEIADYDGGNSDTKDDSKDDSSNYMVRLAAVDRNRRYRESEAEEESKTSSSPPPSLVPSSAESERKAEVSESDSSEESDEGPSSINSL